MVLGMAANNALRLSDWDIRRSFVLILSLLLAFWGSIFLDTFGLSLPLLRQLTGFLLLTFVPGILILRILRIHHLGAVRTTVYAAGLSLTALMFTGFFMNIAYPFFGIFRPFALWPLATTISILIGLLCLLAWFRNWDFTIPVSTNLHRTLHPRAGDRGQNSFISTSINLHNIFSRPILALSLLPFGAIAGTYLMNSYGINTIQMILLLIIALVPVAIVYTRFIPEKYYPYAIFSLAITLLYHTALISTHIWGWDIQYEYYLTNLVIQNSIWDTATYDNCNAMLSLMTLAPTYSILLGIGVEWVFKVIYPLFLALVPLGLYEVFRKQTNEKISFLACFFFMSIFVYYTEMISLARQEVAELFLVLILLSMIDRGLSNHQRSVLLLTFAVSLIVSHYGLSYIFMILLIIALVIIVVEYYVGILNHANWFLNWIRKRTGRFTGLALQEVNFKSHIMSPRFVIWYGLFLLVWYIYMASSSSFESIVYLVHSLMESIFSELFNPDAVQGIATIMSETATPLREVTKYLHLLTIIFIILGFAVTVLKRREWAKFDVQYLLLSCGALGVCIGGVALPYFASALNTSRLYQISLILLAPFGIIGGLALISRLKGLSPPRKSTLHIIAIFLGVFLLFNNGWAFEVGHEVSNFALNNSVDFPVFNEKEVRGAHWLSDTKDGNPVAADTYRGLLLSGFVGRVACHDIQTVVFDDAECYTYIGQHNILHEHIAVTRLIGTMPLTQFIEIPDLHDKLNAIYSNGGARVYYPDVLY